MSNKKFRWILIPIMTIVSLVGILLNVAAVMLETTVDTYLGKGDSYVLNADGTKGEKVNYYEKKYDSAEDAKDAAYEVARKTSEEGSILLKNNGVLPLKQKSQVMPFGRAYLAPMYGQNSSGGSAKWVTDPVTPEQGLQGFTINSAAVELMSSQNDPVGLEGAPGTIVAGEAQTILGGDSRIYEYDATIYNELDEVSNTTGVVFITRTGQEGQDMKFDAYEDGTPHYLALSQNEQQTIKEAKRITDKVVVVVISSAPLELSPILSGELEVDAILWAGHPGERGLSTLSGLLDGSVNPSGRTVDTFAADFTKDPSYQNIGTHTYSNYEAEKPGYMGEETTTIPGYYTEYQEGMYMGYRYYETADEIDDSFVYGERDNTGAVTEKGAVNYPFGYGLSYTTFNQELLSIEESDGNVTAKIKVTNTGEYAGKEVVQLYYSAPYTELGKSLKIEKPVVNLIAFEKTKELASGESEEITMTFYKDDMASYSYLHENSDGTKGSYVLEEGEYTLSLRENSHDVIDEEVIVQPETIWYEGTDENNIRTREITAQSQLDNNGNPTDEPAQPDATYIAATNQFQASSDYMNKDSVILSRYDWQGTQPQAAEGKTKEISEEFYSELGLETSFDVETDKNFGNVEGSKVYAEAAPLSSQDNGLVLSELRGLDYDDEKWNQLLDQIDWIKDKTGLLINFTGAAYITGAVDSIGLPATEDKDGINGLKVTGLDNGYDMSKSASFGFAPLLASTWNKELLYEVGEAIGQESLMHDINGWYAPAINLHRSVFSGRVFEYYSEDPLLSGKMAAAIISGAGDQGLFTYVKHFALNDTETGRAELSTSWADEQTMRELYMKPFEIAIQEAKMTLSYQDEENGEIKQKTIRAATGVMPAQNRVGTIVGHANYNLINNVLREEWGFEGMVVSDYWVWGKDNLRDLTLRSGTDTYLSNFLPFAWNLSDYDSPTAQSVMRNAVHNIAYTVANSNALDGVVPGSVVKVKLSPWQKSLYAVDVLLAVLLVSGVVWINKRSKHEKINPELYYRKNKVKTK